MKKALILGLLLILTSVSHAAESKLQKLTVILDWFPNPDHAPLIVAAEQGFFKEQGLEVELIGPSDPNDPPKWIATKKADIGITYEPQYMEQVDRGLPLIRIGTLIDKPLNCLVALKDSGIKTPADLKGKQIGSTSGGLSSVMLKSILAKNGLANKDVKLINVRYNLTQALLSHQVDAVSGVMRNFEVPQLTQSGYRFSTFFPEDYGIPSYSELIFIAHIENKKDKRFAGFLRAIKKAVVYLDKNPGKTWEQFAKRYPESNNAINREAWFATLPYFAEDPSAYDKDEWEKFADYMQKHQLIKKSQPISRYVTIPS